MQNFFLTYILFGVLPCIVPQVFLYFTNRVKIKDKMPNTFYCIYIYCIYISVKKNINYPQNTNFILKMSKRFSLLEKKLFS